MKTTLLVTWKDGTQAEVESTDRAYLRTFGYDGRTYLTVTLGGFTCDFLPGTYQRIEVGVEMSEKLQPGAFYWIKRVEPDGPPSWEVARYFGARQENWDYWNNRFTQESNTYHYWNLTGRAHPERQITTAGASNCWIIGPKIEEPGK